MAKYKLRLEACMPLTAEIEVEADDERGAFDAGYARLDAATHDLEQQIGWLYTPGDVQDEDVAAVELIAGA